jgi:hypothetical protein
VKRPNRTNSLRAGGTDQAGPRASAHGLPGQKRDFGQRIATGEIGASASDLPGRTRASALGAAKRQGTQGFGSWILSGGTRTSVLDPAGRGTKGFGRRDRQGKEAKASAFKSAERRTAGASAPSGSPRGNRIELRLLSDPGGSGTGASALVSAPRNLPARKASPPRQGKTRRDSGGRQRCRPPFSLRPFSSRGMRALAVAARPLGNSSRPGPVSRQRA